MTKHDCVIMLETMMTAPTRVSRVSAARCGRNSQH